MATTDPPIPSGAVAPPLPTTAPMSPPPVSAAIPPLPDLGTNPDAILKAASVTPPDVAARAKQLGVTPGVVQAGFKPPIPLHPTVKALVQSDFTDAQISQDDLAKLCKIADANDAANLDADARQALIAHHTMPLWLRTLGYQNMQGVGNLLGMVTAQAPAAVTALESVPFIGKRPFLDKAFAWTDTHLNGLARQMQDPTTATFQDPEYMDQEAAKVGTIFGHNKADAAEAVSGMILKNLPTVLGTVGSDLASGGAATWPILGAMTGQMTTQAREEGATPRQALGSGVAKGAVMAGLGMAPFRALGSFMPKILGNLSKYIGPENAMTLFEDGMQMALKRAARGIANESLHGLAFGTANDIIDKISGLRPDLKTGDIATDAVTNAATFALLSPVSGLFHAQAPAVQEAMDNSAKLTSLHEESKDSATAKRDMPTFRKFLDSNLAPREEHFQAVPKEVFENLAAKNQLTPLQFADKLGSTDSYLQSQREGSTAVMVPTAHVVMADDAMFKDLSENCGKAEGGLTPVQAREVAKTASKGEPTKWDEIKSGHLMAFARSLIGAGEPRNPVVKAPMMEHLDAALAADDANTLGPKMMGHVLEGLRGEGALDQPLRAKYGIEGGGPWPVDKTEQLAKDFREYITTPDQSKNQDFDHLADTLEYTYRMHQLAGKETHNSVFDRLIAGRMISKGAALDLGREAWFRKTGNQKYDDAIEQAQRSVQAEIAGKEMRRVQAEDQAKIKGYADQILPGLTRTRWHQARENLAAAKSPEYVASLVGYDNVDEMNADLKANPPAEKQAMAMARELYGHEIEHTPDEMADHLMGVYASTPVERVVKMSADELLRQNPKIAMKLKDDMGKRIDQRYKTGVEGLGLSPRPREDIQAQIASDIGERKLGEFKPGQYLNAQASARRDAAKAYARDDIENTALHKGEELYNIESYRQALKVKASTDQATGILQRLTKKATRDRMSPRFSEQVNQALAQFGKAMPENQKTLDRLPSFIESGLENGDAAEMPLMPSLAAKLASADPSRPMNLRDLTIKEYLSLAHTLNALSKLGVKERGEFKDAIGSNLDQATETVKALPHDRVTLTKGIPGVEKMAAVFMEPSEMVRALDKGDQEGVFHKMTDYFRKAVLSSQEKKMRVNNEISEALKGLDVKTKYDLPESLWNLDPKNHSLTGGQFMDLLGYRGDMQAYEKLCRGHKVDPNTLHFWMQQEAMPQHWDAAEKIAKSLEWIGQEHQAMLRKNMLPEMKMVDKVPFQAGTQVKSGWHHPISFDRDLLNWMNSGESANQSYVNWRTSTGHEKTRVQNNSTPMLMGIERVPGIAHSIINDTEIRVPAQLMNKFLTNPDVKSHVVSVLGEGFHSALNDCWKQATGAPNAKLMADDFMNHCMGIARRNYTMAHMTFRLGINFMHATGLAIQAPVEIGPAAVTNGLKMLTTDFKKSMAFMQDSPEMKSRWAGMTDQDSMNMMNEWQARLGNHPLNKIANIRDSVAGFLFKAYSLTNNIAGSAVFLGEYQKQIETGIAHTDAIARAEDAVRRVVGPANKFDMPALLGSNREYLKMATMYTSYWNHMMNRLQASGRDALGGKRFASQKTRVAAMASMVAWGVVPQIVHHFFEGKDLGPENQGDDDNLKGFLMWNGMDMASHVNPIVSKLMGAEFRYQGNTRRPDIGGLVLPLESADSLVKGGEDIYDIVNGKEDSQGNIAPHLWGHMAGGIGSVMGVPAAEGLSHALDFYRAVHNEDWQFGSPAEKAIHEAIYRSQKR